MSRQNEFQIVCGLWLSPDFSDVLAGGKEPPWVNHSKVDFSTLHRSLLELFPAGPRVGIQVPNDAIAQVAVYVRQVGKPGRTIRCEDFAATLLQAAKSDDKRIIDVSTSWSLLHALSDRSKAPPPVILPFVVTASDFEDSMVWMASARQLLGLPALSDFDKHVKYSGTLPAGFVQQVSAIFGLPYEPMCVLDCMCMDEPSATTY
ncbi:hypothetical protein [Caballeronia sp. DA-9]|uniref:hypothetical protein n=1 Tax=Caballeronia sp. DA-9 TaxID=3436237 RepID=UPI003F66EC0E